MRLFVRNIQLAGRLGRLPTSFIAFLIIAAVSFFQFHNLQNAIILGLTVMFTASYGFAINDYIDFKKDLFAPREHIAAAGLLTRKGVLIVSICFFCISAGLTSLLFPFQRFLNVVLLIILSGYSFVNNKYGIIANVLVAICSAIGIIITLPYFKWSFTVYAGMTFFLHILGREIILDIHDYQADRNIGKTSFPILFTARKSFFVAVFFNLCCIVYSISIGVLFSRWSYIVMIPLANIIFLACLLRYQSRGDEKSYDNFVLCSRVSFLLSIPAILL